MDSQVLFFLFPFSLLTCFSGYKALLRGEYQTALCEKSTKIAVSVNMYYYKRCRHLDKNTWVLLCLVYGFFFPPFFFSPSPIETCSFHLQGVKFVCLCFCLFVCLSSWQVHNWIPYKIGKKCGGSVLLRQGAEACNSDQERSKNTLSRNFVQAFHVKPCLRQ